MSRIFLRYFNVMSMNILPLHMGEDLTRPFVIVITGIIKVYFFTSEFAQEFILAEEIFQYGSQSRNLLNKIQDILGTG